MNFNPQAGSLVARVCEYFAKNPEEELSGADISLKFDTPASRISALLGPAVQKGVLTATKKARMGLPAINIYGAGSGLPPLSDGTPPTGFHGWLEKKALKTSEGRAAGAALPDPASLRVEPGVAIPQPMSARSLQYQAVFASMKVGDSFPLSTAAAKPLVATARSWGKTCGRVFITRRVSETESRIWRTE